MVEEKKGTCCHKCGHVHVKGTACPKPYLTGDRSCKRRQNESIDEVGTQDTSYENIINYVNNQINQEPSKAAELAAKILYFGEGNEDLQQDEKEKYLKLKTDPITLLNKIQNFLRSVDKDEAREIEQELGLTVDELSTMDDFNSTEHQTLPADYQEGLKLEGSYGQTFVVQLQLSGNSQYGVVVENSYFTSGDAESVALDIAKDLLIDSSEVGDSFEDVVENNGIDIMPFKNKDLYNIGIGGETEWFVIGPKDINLYEEFIHSAEDPERFSALHSKVWDFEQDMQEFKTLENKLKKSFNTTSQGQLASKALSTFSGFSQNESLTYEADEVDKYCPQCLAETLLEYKDKIEEAEYRGRKVQLGKPFNTPGGPKKRSVYVKNAKGNVVKVNFGDPNMKIKKSNPKRRKSFRARHNCDNPGPRWKARYWSCKAW